MNNTTFYKLKLMNTMKEAIPQHVLLSVRGWGASLMHTVVAAFITVVPHTQLRSYSKAYFAPL